MHLVYVDDSKGDNVCIYSALIIEDKYWFRALSMLREYRAQLRNSDGIYMNKEFHACDFVAGRGNIGSQIVPKGRRCEIYRNTLRFLTTIPGLKVMNATLAVPKEQWVFERLLNRINRSMQSIDSYALLICDQGKNAEYTRLKRQMHHFNPIPSQFGVWRDGATTKNIPLDRIIEDPVFKDSDQSYFVQMADFCAYALLQKERPLASRMKYGLHEAFNLLDPILFKMASRCDPQGVIR